jgi:hypothetical protein
MPRRDGADVHHPVVVGVGTRNGDDAQVFDVVFGVLDVAAGIVVEVAVGARPSAQVQHARRRQ